MSNLAICFQKQNDTSKAKFYNECCLQKNPKHVKSRFRKVGYLKAEKKFEEAMEIAIELADEDPAQFGNLLDDFHKEAKDLQKISEIRK